MVLLAGDQFYQQFDGQFDSSTVLCVVLCVVRARGLATGRLQNNTSYFAFGLKITRRIKDTFVTE